MSSIAHSSSGSIALIDPNTPPPKQDSRCMKRLDKFHTVVLNPDNPVWINTAGGLARAVTGVAKPFFSFFRDIARGLAATQMTAALSMPFDLYQLSTGIAGNILEKRRIVRFDNALLSIGDFSQLGDGIANFTMGLADVGAISSTVMTWAAPLSLACSVVSGVFFVINGRGLYINRQLLKELKQATQTIEGSEAAVTALLNKRAYDISRHGGADGAELLATIKKVHAAYQAIPVKTEADKAGYLDKLSKAYDTLRKRIKHKNISHALGIAITTIGIIASIIFFVTMTTIWSVAGCAFLIALYMCSISKMTLDKVADRQYTKGLAKLTPPPPKVHHHPRHKLVLV